jgi:aldehyde:ferredoxin oxidoreductase
MTSPSYNGRVLHVDLTDRRIWVENPPDSFYRTYGGGSAMGLYYILNEMPRGIDPLSADNILTVFLSVLTGLPISGLSRVTVNAKSPLTGAIGDSQAGGFFPARMKASGFDGIVIRGRSSEPVYLLVKDGNAELRDAKHLWGKITGEVDDLVKSELGDNKVEIMQVGPAGEKLVRFASIMNMSNRANGRTGMGAVMGSKNLKAIVVQGNSKLTAVDAVKITQMNKMGTGRIKDNPGINSYHLYGTAGDVPAMQAMGGLPTRNFNEGQFDGFDIISGEHVAETILKERDTCFACTVRCKRVVETEFNGEKVLPGYGGAEYESTATLGSYCSVSDIHAISLANQICNQYGMDTISCGATVAFAMECFENGLLTLEHTGDLDLDRKSVV